MPDKVLINSWSVQPVAKTKNIPPANIARAIPTALFVCLMTDLYFLTFDF